MASAIELVEHDYALWEKRADAILVLLSGKGLMTVDELRRNIESRRRRLRPYDLL